MKMPMIEATIARMKKDYAFSEDFVISLVLTDHTGMVLVEEAGDRVLHAASLIKVPILLKALVDYDSGALILSEKMLLKQSDKVGGCGILTLMDEHSEYTVLEILKLMICVSDNTATNMMIDRLGIDAINNLLKSINLKDTQVARKLMMGDMKQFSSTTAAEMTMMLRLFMVPALLSESARKLGMEILYGQQFNDRLSHEWLNCGSCGALIGHRNTCKNCGDSVAEVDPIPVTFAHKTGEITGMVHDAGILTLDSEVYTIACLTKGLLKNTDGQVILSNIGMAILEDLHCISRGVYEDD